MKKTLVMGILGLAVGAASSYGQGSIQFNTYIGFTGCSGLLTEYLGVPLNNTYTGELLYSTTPITEAAGVYSGPLNPLWQIGSTASFHSNPAIPDGYLQGPNFTLTSYVSGQVYFEIIAFNGASYGAGSLAGHSASFHQGMATGATSPWPADGNPSALNGSGSGIIGQFTVGPVPEPTTLALGGLGGLALLLMRRKQS